jgi:hypothetical protein
MVSAVIIVTMASGCTGTVSPTPSPTVLTATATPNPSAKPAPEPTATATPGPTPIAYPGPSIPPGTLVIEIAAIPKIKFDTSRLEVPADTPFAIRFENRDTCSGQCGAGSGTAEPHNVAIKLGDLLLFNPLPALEQPATVDYFIPEGLSAGAYRFLCIIHPVMSGTLTVE